MTVLAIVDADTGKLAEPPDFLVRGFVHDEDDLRRRRPCRREDARARGRRGHRRRAPARADARPRRQPLGARASSAAVPSSSRSSSTPDRTAVNAEFPCLPPTRCTKIVGVSISDAAADVMGLAQDGKVEAALRPGRPCAHPGRRRRHRPTRPPSGTPSPSPSTSSGDNEGAFLACDRCLALAAEAGNAGWASNALSMRAMAQARQGAMEPALLDLARAEVELDRLRRPRAALLGAHRPRLLLPRAAALRARPPPLGGRRWSIDASPIPLTQARGHRPDEPRRAAPALGRRARAGAARGLSDDEVDEHRKRGPRVRRAAVAEAERPGPPRSSSPPCRAMELCARPRDDRGAAAPRAARGLRAAPDHPDYQGGRAAVGGALARALWATGQRDEALERGPPAVGTTPQSAGDWQVTASAQWLLVEMQAAAGVPGADAGRSYARLLSRVLWQQRLSTLARAPRPPSTSSGSGTTTLAAQRAALEDPLTGVGNRRALDDALRAGPARGPRRTSTRRACSCSTSTTSSRSTTGTATSVGDAVLRSVGGRDRGRRPAPTTSSRGSAATSSWCWPAAPTRRPARGSPSASRRR